MADSTGAWGVFPHAEQRKVTGRGYVVRAMESGHAVDQYNYGGIVPVAVFSKRAEKAAERLAGKLTEGNTNPRRRAAKRRRNPAGWGKGKDFQSTGPIKTVTQLKRAAKQLLRFVRPDSKMAAAAYSALRNPDAFMARPDWQVELLDYLKVYALARDFPITLIGDAGHAEKQRETVRRLTRRGKKNPLLGIFGANPRARVVRELGRVVEVRYKRKDDGRLYFHKYSSKPRLLALSDGSIWIKGA